MIIKKSVMKSNDKSSYARLAKYIMEEQTVHKIRNIGMWNSSGYDNDDIDLFMKEVKAVQDSNTLSKDDKTYHLIVSFKEDEIDINKLKNIENEIVTAMGFEEHQRLCVVHNDTDNLHLHIAINKINPETNKIYTPYRDYQKLNDIAAAIEFKYGLKEDNHIKSERPYSKAVDIEKSSYLQSLQSYIKNIDLNDVTSWEDFHIKLNEAGIMYQKKGAGAVFTNENKKLYVKASSIDREYSIKRLVQRFGKYKPYQYDVTKTVDKYEKKAINDNGLYEEYKLFNENRKNEIKNSIEQVETAYINKLDTELYNIKKLMNMTLLSHASYMEKVIINKVFNSMIKDKKESLYKQKREEKFRIYKNNPYLRFNEWVKKEALNNNLKAIDFINNQIAKENYIVADFSSHINNAVKVTKNGTYITADNIRLRTNGINVRSCKEYAVLKNLEYYKQIYPDKPLIIKGSKEFKEQVINVIAKYNIQLKFNDERANEIIDRIKLTDKLEHIKLLKDFNKIHNDKMYKYKQLDFKEKEYEYRGFFKHHNSYFLIVRSYETNTFYIKEPTKDDYKNIKGLQKGSTISFAPDNRINENLILDDLIKVQEEKKLKYLPLTNENIDKLIFQGVRRYKNEIIYLYKDNNKNRIYTKIATKEDKEQYRKKEDKILSDKILSDKNLNR